MEDTPTAKIRSMAVGRTEVEGTIRKDESTLQPPYTNGECVRSESPLPSIMSFIRRTRRRRDADDPKEADDDNLFESAVDLVTDVMESNDLGLSFHKPAV